MSDWRLVQLGDVSITYDHLRIPVRSADRRPGPYPYYGASGVVDHVESYIFDGEYLLIAEDGENLRTRRTPIAFVATGRFWVNNHAHVIRGNNLANTRFLGYALAETDISGHLSGSTQPKLTQAALKSVRLRIPDRNAQDSIVALLGALDEKIEINERIAEIANTLTRARMRALWRKVGITSLTEDQSPTSPNFNRTTLGTLCKIRGGSIQTGPFGSQLHASDYVEFGTPSVMPQNIGENIILEDGISRITSDDAHRLSRYLLTEGDIVYSRRGDVKRRALVRKHEAGWLCGTGCLRVRLRDPSEALFISNYLGEPEIQEWVLRHAVGATMPNLNTSILEAVPVVLPELSIRLRLIADLMPIDERATQGLYENRKLAELRDALLPELMSGRLRVREAEKVVEDAV